MSSPDSISVDKYGNVTVVRLIGEHDVSTVDELRATLDTLPAAPAVVVSLAEATFFDSSVIHTLVATDAKLKQQNQKLVLHIPPRSLAERVLQTAQSDAHIPLARSLDEALVLADRQTGPQ
jgi:anti-anti-sigma factor